MPHFKCVACKTRLYSAAAPADLVGDLCPGCGSLLEPVGERDGAADGSRPRGHQSIAGRVDALFARREALLAHARLDAERWVDDGGSFGPETVAQAAALAKPEENV